MLQKDTVKKTNTLKVRSGIISDTRDFFTSQNYLEIDCPVLVTSVPDEPNIYPFKTIWQYNQQNLNLSTSPESVLKQFISQNPSNCFSIAKCFRDLEATSRYHQPEFTMLEWYQLDANLEDIIDTTKNYIQRMSHKYNKRINNKFNTISLKNITANNEPDWNQKFLNEVENSLPQNCFNILIDYPSFLSPLAAVSDSQLAIRFELYYGSIELANGCVENLQPKIKTTWKNLPPTSGCGLGLDRFIMLLTESDNIDQVLPLPL